MTARLFVVDTKVVVAGLITGEPAAPTREILDRMLDGRLRFVLSEVLLGEYREVLLRPPIRAAHGLSPEDVDELLVKIVELAVVAAASGTEKRPSRSDDGHLDALLELFPSAILVSGDRAARDRAATRGLSPRDLVDRGERR